MSNRRGDSSWHSELSPGRRRTKVGAIRLTRLNVLLILLINAFVSLLISIIVFLVFSRIMGYGSAPAQQAVFVPETPAITLTSIPIETSQGISTPAGSQEIPDVYVVRSGDNLSLIAAQFGVTMEELMLANGIENPDWIGVGQKLVIPKPGAPTATSTVPPIPTVTETPLPFDPPTPVATLSPTATSTVPEAGVTITPTATSIATSSGLVSIDIVRGIGSLASEEIIIRNKGQLVDLEGWTLSDKDNNVFTFPSIVLWPDATLRIHSGQGNDTPTDLYWNKTEVIWADEEEVATLKNDEGQTIATYRP